jgi:hypothetical protein
MTTAAACELAAGVDEQAIADYWRVWPEFVAAVPGAADQLTSASVRMRQAADPVTGLALLPGHAVGFDDQFADGSYIAGSASDGPDHAYVIRTGGYGNSLPLSGRMGHRELVAVKPGRTWFAMASRRAS